MGIPTDRFIGSEHEKFVCAICLDVAEDPLVVRNCEHIFCKACLEKANSTRCPSCQHSFEPHCPWTPIQGGFRRCYLDLKMKCSNVGCDHQSDVSNYKSHDEQCPLMMDVCELCGYQSKRHGDDDHDCSKQKLIQVDAQTKEMSFNFKLFLSIATLIILIISGLLIGMFFWELSVKEELEKRTENVTSQMERVGQLINGMNVKINTTNDRIREAEKRMSDADAKLAEADAKMNAFNSRIVSTDQKMKNEEAKLDNIIGSVRAINDRIGAAEKKIGLIENIDDRIKKMDSRINGEDAKMNNIADAVQVIEDKLNIPHHIVGGSSPRMGTSNFMMKIMTLIISVTFLINL